MYVVRDFWTIICQVEMRKLIWDEDDDGELSWNNRSYACIICMHMINPQDE